MTSQVDLKPLLSRHNNPKDIAEIESKLYGILQPVVNDPKSSKASDVAGKIDELFSSGYSGDKAEDFLYTLWNFYIEAAKEVPAENSAAMGLLADVVAKLKRIDRETVEIWGKNSKVWGDLPMLGPCMRDAWNFEPKFDKSQDDSKKISQWISLNSIAARLLGSGVQTWTNFAIWALRETLEIPPPNDTARDAGLGVAAVWFIHAGKELRSEIAEAHELSESEKRSLAPGKLFSEGQSGLSEERWNFWRNRVEELGAEAGEHGKKASENAIDALDGA